MGSIGIIVIYVVALGLMMYFLAIRLRIIPVISKDVSLKSVASHRRNSRRHSSS